MFRLSGLLGLLSLSSFWRKPSPFASVLCEVTLPGFAGGGYLLLPVEFGCCRYAVPQCCSEIQVLRCCSAAVLRSEGSRDEGRGKRQEEGVGRVKGKVCFGFFLLDDPCPSDYAQGQRCSLETQETSISDGVDSGFNFYYIRMTPPYE